MTTKTYGEQAIAALLFKEGWAGLGSWHERRDSGVWVVPPLAQELQCLSDEAAADRVAHPLSDLDRPALPFPFSAAEFIAFCKSHPSFVCFFIDSPFSNDDDSLDEAAIAELARRSQPAAELVRLLLTAAELFDVQPIAAPVKAEKARERGHRLMREILVRLGADTAGVPLDPGGRRAHDSLKSKAKRLALTPELGFTEATFLKAWAEYPKKKA